MIKLSPEGEAILREAVANIEFDPSTWHQDTWIGQDLNSSCGTTACLAGHIVAIAESRTLPNMSEGGHRLDCTIITHAHSIPARALEALGLAEYAEIGVFAEIIPSLDGRAFLEEVFYVTDYDPDHNEVGTANNFCARESEKFGQNVHSLKVFKEHLTAVTGVEF